MTRTARRATSSKCVEPTEEELDDYALAKQVFDAEGKSREAHDE
jgi:hypothetical protein